MRTIGSHVCLQDEGLGSVTILHLERRGLHIGEALLVGESGRRWEVEGGVLVPDPCLSGAAMFTVRKEAVNCVCSHLNMTEQLLTTPLHTETERDQCAVHF